MAPCQVASIARYPAHLACPQYNAVQPAADGDKKNDGENLLCILAGVNSALHQGVFAFLRLCNAQEWPSRRAGIQSHEHMRAGLHRRPTTRHRWSTTPPTGLRSGTGPCSGSRRPMAGAACATGSTSPHTW